jgi:hypothetical protein
MVPSASEAKTLTVIEDAAPEGVRAMLAHVPAPVVQLPVTALAVPSLGVSVNEPA